MGERIDIKMKNHGIFFRTVETLDTENTIFVSIWMENLKFTFGAVGDFFFSRRTGWNIYAIIVGNFDEKCLFMQLNLPVEKLFFSQL